MINCLSSVKAQNPPESNFKDYFRRDLIYRARDLGYDQKDCCFATIPAGNACHPG